MDLNIIHLQDLEHLQSLEEQIILHQFWLLLAVAVDQQGVLLVAQEELFL
jgi:hypothetical protein